MNTKPSKKQSYFSFLFKFSLLALASSAIAPIAPAKASDPAIVTKAESLCLEKAKADGFELKEVMYRGGAEIPGKDAKIVLQLMRDGAVAKLTCYYDKASGSVNFGEDAAPATPKVAAPSVPWWAFILPLLGLLALWFLGKDKAEEESIAYGHRYETIIRSGSGDPIPVHEEPSFASKVVGHVYNGDRVTITDSIPASGKGDWIQLEAGGWVSKEYAGIPTR